MKKRIAILLVAAAAGFLFAQSQWEGTTAMGRYGEFPNSGYYAASNSFPRNTLVKVENLENGTSVTVLIVDRLEDPGLFLLLSRDAAQEIGITDDQVVRTKVVLADNSSRLATENGDRPYSADPDINPGAAGGLAFLDRYLDAEESTEPAPPRPEAIVEAPIAEPEPEPETAPPEAGPEPVLEKALPEEEPAPVPGEPDLPQPLAAATVVVAPEAEPEPEPEPEPVVPAGPFIEELFARAPGPASIDIPLEEPELMAMQNVERTVDDLYNPDAPEGEDTLAVADIPVTPEARRREQAIAEQFPLPEPPYDGGEESFAVAAPLLLEGPSREPAPEAVVKAPVETEPLPEPDPVPQAVTEGGDVEIVLEPAGERPPVVESEPETVAAAPEALPPDGNADVAVAFRLDPQFHYLQLGVFSSAGTARTTAARFSSIYPVMVLNQDNALYKVLVGPLSPDESGALLLNFRSQGYRDAFIRKGF